MLESDRTGVEAPAGLAFSSASGSFYVIGARPSGALADTEVVKLTPFALSRVSDRAGSARIAAALKDPVNMAFDTRGNRLLLLDAADRLLEVRADSSGDLDPTTLVRRDALRLDLRDPQGMAVDPASGVVFVLDAATPRIVRIEPDANGSYDAATTSDVDLQSGVTGVRGLAFDPTSGHLQLGSAQGLVELTASGAVVTTRDLSRLGLGKPAGMAFAPSGDLTDASSELSVYVADTGTGASPGQIVELSLTPLVAPPPINFTAALVNTVDTSLLSPPSPDPCGIAYVPSSDRLLISDCEVEETVNGITHFQGANVWELNRIGLTPNRTANISNVPPGVVVPVTNEPGGAAFNPTNGHYYFSADDGKKVYDVDPGADGLVGTAGDTVSSFDTLAAGNADPEGIAYDTFGGHLFVTDGLNREVYEFTTSGTLVNHFDTAQYGIEDPESVEFNPVSGTLFILSDRNNTTGPVPVIIETTRTGGLIRTIGASASNTFKPAGLAYGPASDGSAVKHFYIADRGIDNNVDPNAVDGKLYEMTAPTPDPPSNLPPVVSAGPDQAAALPAAANLDGTVSDDLKPSPPGAVTTTWTLVSGPSTVTFGNANAIDTTASVPVPGIYVVRLTANDSQYAVSDDVTLTFTGSGSVGVVDVRVSVAGDDAEEVASVGTVQRGDGDLDMMIDTADTKQVVGVRFNGIAIPQGASISNAYLQFQADESHSVATTLAIKGQAADNAPGFTTNNFDVSSRPTTAASAAWSPGAWLAVGDAGLAQRTTNLASIIQEIVGRSGWASSNSLALFVTGSGRRVAVSHNQIPAAAALLHVEWNVGGGNTAPVITSNGGGPTAAASPVENQTAVTDVNAADPDPNTLTYSIAGGLDAARFAIVPSTGVLTFVSAPSFESPTDNGANNVYDVVVSVSDGAGGSDSQAIAATVVNVNEFPPVITSDGNGAPAALSRPENSTAVTDVNATDGDGDPVAYSVSGGADATRFTIDPSTGVLTFLVAPDFELPGDAGANNVYNVIVSASDGSLSDAQTIAVTVTDVNESGSPPTITSDGGGATAALSKPENSTAVTDVNATDPDVGDTLTYSITGGADMSAFTIVPSTGVLAFLNAPNFELPTDVGMNNVYDVIVTVSDGNRTDTQAIAVTVSNVNEFSPVITSDGGGVSAALAMPENQSVVTDVDATDGDVGPLTYSISGGTDASDFTINSSTGLLSFATPPDFEAPADANLDNIYEVTGSVSDGTLSDTQALTVTVTDVAETAGSPLYFSLFDAATLSGVPVANEDIVFFDGTAFSLAFDGSDVGITNLRIDGLARISANAVLLSFDADRVVPGIAGTVDDSDIVRFDGSLGAVTSGTFSMYFDGSDVGLTTTAHDVDAVELLPNGHLLVSTTGSATVSGVAVVDEDLLEFVPTSIGNVTAGTFSMHFDGSDVALNTNSGEDVDGVAVDASGKIHLSTLDLFAVTGVSGEDDDVSVFTPSSLGPVTAGTFSPTLYFDGSAFGLTANDVFAIDLP